jgi:hypothetical protein
VTRTDRSTRLTLDPVARGQREADGTGRELSVAAQSDDVTIVSGEIMSMDHNSPQEVKLDVSWREPPGSGKRRGWDSHEGLAQGSSTQSIRSANPSLLLICDQSAVRIGDQGLSRTISLIGTLCQS